MKAVIFGCGEVGIQAKEKLEAEGMEILAFADNDDCKWNNTFENYKVISPKEISLQPYDFIAIGIYKAVDIIKTQLIRLGIPKEKIIVPIEPPRIFYNPISVSQGELEDLDPFEYESENTRAYLRKQIILNDNEFFHKLDDLKQTLKNYNIPRKKVCIVSGAVLQAYGLRKSKKFDDIDIIMTNDLRELYGKGLVIVSSTAEMHPQDEYIILDDEIINNTKYHFVFQDLKFACLEIINKRLE